jgi:hypothetical protein
MKEKIAHSNLFFLCVVEWGCNNFWVFEVSFFFRAGSRRQQSSDAAHHTGNCCAMALTDILKTGLEAAILEYLTAEGGRFARTVAAFKEEAHEVGRCCVGFQRGGDGEGMGIFTSLSELWACHFI